MQLVTRAVVQPAGGGEPVDVFDLPLPEELEADLLLAYYTQTLGEPVDTALTDVPGVAGPVPAGWVFAVPATFELPGPHEQYELVVYPMVADPGQGLISLFVSLAQDAGNPERRADRSG